MEVRPLPPLLEKLAEAELNETPDKLEYGIQHMKDWIARQPHLRARTDDQWLVIFLRGCKHRLERAKEKLDLYYSLRSIAPDMYAFKHSNPRFLELFKSGIALVLPKRVNPTDPRVVLVRAGRYDPSKYNLSEFFAVSLVHQQMIFMEDDAFVVAGSIKILDFEGTTMSHFLQMTPTQMKKMIVSAQDASPMRLKSAHYLNTPRAFETAFNIGKQFLNEKNRNRMYVHSEMDELYKYVSKDILPVEYGGNGGTIQEIIDDWTEKLKKYDSWLEEDMQYGTDEAKRLGKSKSAELFGVDGSFRQLEFD